MIDVWRAVSATQRILPEKLALGAVRGGATIDQSITVQNIGDTPQTYTFSAKGSHGTPIAIAGGKTLVVGPREMGKTRVQLTIPADLVDQALFSGWITVTNSAGDIVGRIPYLGFKGDYQADSALDPLVLNLPWLARLDGDFLYKTNSLTIHPKCRCDNQTAWLLFSLARQAQQLRIEIWDPSTKRKWGDAFQADFLGRSAGAIESFQWDGTNDKGRQLPPGTYVLRMMVLRPLGDPLNPAHWDTWISGPINLIYD
jgi:minor extracellular serine protease Vpr